MFYIVECSYNDPCSERKWNTFYSEKKLPALLSVNGFRTSQRFKALSTGCPVYLAWHTVRNADVLTSDDYRLKGGGNFAAWQPHITDWHRNLYSGANSAPDISAQEILLLAEQPLDFLATELGLQAYPLEAVGLDKSPARRVAYILPQDQAELFSQTPGVFLYTPITPQLQAKNA